MISESLVWFEKRNVRADEFRVTKDARYLFDELFELVSEIQRGVLKELEPIFLELESSVGYAKLSEIEGFTLYPRDDDKTSVQVRFEFFVNPINEMLTAA